VLFSVARPPRLVTAIDRMRGQQEQRGTESGSKTINRASFPYRSSIQPYRASPRFRQTYGDVR